MYKEPAEKVRDGNPFMVAPCERLENGNTKLFYESGEDCGADYIIFDCGIFAVPGALSTVVEDWTNGPSIEVPEPDEEQDILMNYVASYKISDDSIRYFHITTNADTDEEVIHELPLTTEQAAQLRLAMEKYCDLEKNCTLREYWDRCEKIGC